MIVVAGVDDSPVSKQVVDRAIEEARWREAELHLVHVVYLPIVYTEVPINWSEVAEAQRQAVWDNLEETTSGVDVPLQKVDVDGYPPDALVGYANDVEADLLVVGTRGRGEFASLVLGSTSHRAIHLAGCDVLVVKAETGGDDAI
jgi:universal stress protein A